MKTRNNIDDLFRESLAGYTAEPSPGLWRRLERRFFPPSRFSPSGLITPIILLFVAGLMPWLLIPANNRDERQPNLPEGTVRKGYLIQPDDGEALHRNSDGEKTKERKFSVKPTVYVERPVDPVSDPGPDYLASVNDPAEDPAILPLLKAIRESGAGQQDDYASAETNSAEVRQWLNRMKNHGTGLLNPAFYAITPPGLRSQGTKSAFSKKYEDDYFRKGEWSAGLVFSPAVVFYDPNPSNQMLGMEATAQYHFSNFSIRTGLGVSRMEDVASYRIDYTSYDSVGYYLDVVSFSVDPKNGQVTFHTRQAPVYDSVPHYIIEEKTNYYTYLDIPLSFGYDFLKKGRITLTAQAGIKFSALVHKEEPTVDFTSPGGEPIGIENQVPARTNTNWRFTAGVDFGYLFVRNFSLHLEPVFEQYITPVYSKQPGYDAGKPYVIGVRAGLKYHF